MSDEFKPYVPEKTKMTEFTFKAILLGIFLSIILGAANAYLGLKAGMTVAATFPAAVIAMAFMRLFKGTILEENLARTTGAVGEALAAGAVFVIPAFVISGAWSGYNYLMSTILMLVGGILGVLFVIILRRTLVEDVTLPYPESKACAEIVKAGQHGATGAGLVFGSMGLAALIEFFKNERGITLIKSVFKGALKLGSSTIRLLDGDGNLIKAMSRDDSGLVAKSPKASPAFLGVGYIIGPRLASITFSGGVFGWLFLMPLVVVLLMNKEMLGLFNTHGWADMAQYAYNATVKPLAVGGMLVGSFYTLFSMRKNLIQGLGKGLRDIRKAGKSGDDVSRINKDAPFGIVLIAVLVLVFVMVVIFQSVIKQAGVDSWGGAALSAVVMAVAGFLFAAVAGYLVGLIGSSSNPISGLALTTLIMAAVLMVIVGLKGDPGTSQALGGVAATLAVAAVVACTMGVAGDMMQDWKVGHFLGGTPWKMQIGGLIGVVAAALVLVLPIILLDHSDPKFAHAVGFSPELPAPQANLMAMMAKGIVGGEMAWPLVIAGMFFAVGLILIKAPSPMLIAVGMYLPFETTFAIFVGGMIKFFVDKSAVRSGEKKAAVQKMDGEKKAAFIQKIKEKSDNHGILLASGLVAGEALMGILLAALVPLNINLNKLIGNWDAQAEEAVIDGRLAGTLLYFAVFAILTYVMISIPLRKIKKEDNG
jgi:putative OPT family oligopeptide transporter